MFLLYGTDRLQVKFVIYLLQCEQDGNAQHFVKRQDCSFSGELYIYQTECFEDAWLDDSISWLPKAKNVFGPKLVQVFVKLKAWFILYVGE